MKIGNRTRNLRAFSLIELLVVISIIAILAAMTLAAFKNAHRRKLLTRARGELQQVESYIDGYKARLGHYPPDNRIPANNQLLPGLNQLYYELAGTAFMNGAFVTKDKTSLPLTPNQVAAFFGPGVPGFINSDRGTSEEGQPARQFLTGLKPGQAVDTTITNQGTGMTVTARILVCTVPGPDPNTPPLNNGSPALNPWRYNSSSPTNNTTTYDLWTDIFIDNKTNRICNWSAQPLIVH